MTKPSTSSHVGVVIIGGGQAGLAMSYHLQQSGIDHVILEKNQIAHSWRTQRWDAFCLVTPNCQSTYGPLYCTELDRHHAAPTAAITVPRIR